MRAYEVATLAGGCFWCLEAVFEEMRGVAAVESGYTGGERPAPTYAEVSSGRTGHIEAVRVTFDPAAVSYREILEVFFGIHDPTSRDRQGNDAGTQYRSAIFFHTEAQRATAQEVIQELEAAGVGKIVTEIRPAPAFYKAEAYHQQYYRTNPEQSYCAYVIAPKLSKFRAKFGAQRRAGA
jgi:peptide-methionine (S)-S-oxide reductase